MKLVVSLTLYGCLLFYGYATAGIFGLVGATMMIPLAAGDAHG